MTEATKWYVVRHSNDRFSVQDKPQGGGLLLQVAFDDASEREATLVCAAANDAARALLPRLQEALEALEYAKDYLDSLGRSQGGTPAHIAGVLQKLAKFSKAGQLHE